VNNLIEKILRVKFENLSPVLFCRIEGEERKQGEAPGEFEKRIWKKRAHYNEEGKVVIPGYMIKTTLEPAAKLLGRRVGGKKMGKSLAHYLRLIRIDGDILTNITEENLEGITAFVSSDGKPGGGRVPRTYPKINKWEGTLTLSYPDLGTLNDDIVMEHLEVAGSCVGIGHWRPGAPSCGNYGRFRVEKVG
jgi:hypothetical protein